MTEANMIRSSLKILRKAFCPAVDSQGLIILLGFMVYQLLLGYLMLKSVILSIIWFQVTNDKILFQMIIRNTNNLYS